MELLRIEQDFLPQLTLDDPAFEHFPIREVDYHLLQWEQLDNFQGLQAIRGLDGSPTRVQRTGAKRYSMIPGVYGEYEVIDEQELVTRRELGSYGEPIKLDDLVIERQDKLLNRRLDRLRQIIWTLLSTGTFSVATPYSGVTQHTDTFNIQTATAGVAWSSAATATPLADFRDVQLLSRGFSVDFGSSAKAYMNRATANELFANTNANDIGGKRLDGLRAPIGMEDANTVLLKEGLPQIEIYDKGYINEAGTFTLFIPNDKVVIIGSRPSGATVGEYRMTRNANNPNLEPGAYTRVLDRGEQTVPRTFEVHDGHNGGPILYFASAIVVLTV